MQNERDSNHVRKDGFPNVIMVDTVEKTDNEKNTSSHCMWERFKWTDVHILAVFHAKPTKLDVPLDFQCCYAIFD